MKTGQNGSRNKIDLAEYARRREAVLKALKGAAGVVFAGDGSPPLVGKWQPDSNFFYLTGLETEAGAAVLFDPNADTPKRRCILFLRPLNPERERWDGYREQIGSALKAATGFETVMRSDSLPAVLTGAARRGKALACLHPFKVYPAEVSPDLSVFRKVSERVPGVAIQDRVNLLPSLRAIKSAGELNLIRKAIAITAAGYEAATQAIRPGATEEQVAQVLEQTYARNGAQGVAFNAIVGAGLSSTVLHYMDNNAEMKNGDLLLVDSGAAYGRYAADVTRTFPVSGKFTSEQRDVYEVVLAAQMASIKTARVGVSMNDVDEAARNVIEKAGYGDAFIHGIGHQLGIEVHDATPDGSLKAGMVVTIEPGVYLPERKLGVRIEDDILIKNKGNEVLSAAIPKSVKEIEAAVRK